MLVIMHTHQDVELGGYMYLTALRDGHGEGRHFDELLDTLDVLIFGATEADDHETLAVCELGVVAMANIKDRHTATGKLIAEEDEYLALHLMVTQAHDFWQRRPGTAFKAAHAELIKLRDSQTKGAKPCA